MTNSTNLVQIPQELERKKSTMSARSKDTQGRNWLFTQNNPTMTDEEFFNHLVNTPSVKYFVFCRERGDGTPDKQGTEHFQGYIEFVAPKLHSTVCNLIPKAHVLPRGGTKKQCIDYVKKIGAYADKKHTQIGEIYEFGDTSEQGGRKDLEEIKNEILLDGLTPREMVFNRTMNLQQIKLTDRLYTERMNAIWSEEIRHKIKVVYLYGEGGVGKTRYIYDTYKPSEMFHVILSEKNKNPFDKYRYQNILVLDEFESHFFDLEFMNGLLDRYPFNLPCRFEDKYAAFSKVYIISNTPLQQQYRNYPEIKRQTFFRRIHEIREIKAQNLDLPANTLIPIDNIALDTIF